MQETGFPASSLVSARAGHRECVKCGVLTASDWCPDGTGHFLCHACSFTRLYEAGLSGSALLYPSRRGYETNDTGDKTASLSADAAEAVVNASAVASLETGKLDDALFSPAGQTKASAEVDEVDSAAYTASVSGYRPPLTHVAFHHSPANQPQPQPQPQHQHQHQTYHQHQHQYQHAHRGQPSTNSEADLRFPHPPQGHGLRGDDRLPRQDHNPQQQMHLQAVARPPSARETPAPRAIGHPSYPAHFQPNHSHNHTHPQHHHQAPVQEMAPPQPQQQVELESPENARVSEEVYAYPLRPSGYMNHFAPTHPFYQPYMQTQAAAYPAYPNTGGMISSFPGYPSDRPAPHPLPMEEAFSGPLAEDRYRGDALQTNRLLSHSVCPEAAPPSSGLKTTSTGFAGATGTGGTTTTSAGLAYTCPSGGVGLVSMSTMAACAAAAVSAAAAAAAVGVTGSLVGVRKTASETGVIEDSAFPPPQLPPLPGVKTTSHQHICCPGAMERRPGGCDLAGDEASEAGRKSRLDSPFCQNLGPVRPRSATGNNRRQVSCFA
ncbi:unnamed protein product [Protopolystoma xenopodis]|uniref:GATA-type domain-containing protein n=1 Tax=Protopolystoma xenopodis TaxID=117903 RepID=A0A3S5B4P1_9PLAT|nr:unnamed protein product [Protopolystoma xenopodis]